MWQEIGSLANDDEECSRPVEVVETQDRVFLYKFVACLAKETTSGGREMEYLIGVILSKT